MRYYNEQISADVRLETIKSRFPECDLRIYDTLDGQDTYIKRLILNTQIKKEYDYDPIL